MTAAYFEELYRASPDPWDLATSPYEADKYAATVAALGDRRFADGLEVGCSIGVLTGLLAARCDRLLAMDAAPAAVAAARERLAGVPGVTVERRRAPDELPAGPFDLIVCSEVLYYLDLPLLREAWGRLRDALAPGGALLAVHWTGPVRHYPLSGEAVHAHLRADHAGLAHAVACRRPDYLLDRFDRC